MKTILCLIGIVTLVLTSGCATRHRGATYGVQEYQSGEFESSRPANRDRGYYWDNHGNYHEYNGKVERVFPM